MQFPTVSRRPFFHPLLRAFPCAPLFCLLLALSGAARAVTIADTQLPAAVVGEPYPGFSLTASAGTAPYTWAITSGALPTGLTLQPGGLITGTPANGIDTTPTFRVTDGLGAQASKALTQVVTGPPAATALSWDRRGQLSGYIYEIDVSPNYATDNTLFAHGRGADLYRTSDRGVTWSRHDLLNGVVPGYVSYNDLTLPPNYRFTTNPASQPESEKSVFAVYNYVVFKSVDHGNSFAQIHCDNTNSRCLNIALSPAYASNGTLYALVETGVNWPYGYELHRSTDRGANWTVHHSFVSDRTLTQFLAIAPDGLTMFLRAYSNTLAGYRVFKSTDGGSAWVVTSALTGTDAFSQIIVSPTYASDATVVLRTSGTGVNYLHITRNGGGSWQQLTNTGFSDRFSYLAWIARPAQVPLLALYAHHQPSGRYSLLVSDDRGVTFVPKFTAGARPVDTFGLLGFAASPLLAGGAVDYFMGSLWGLDGSSDGGFSFTPHEKGIDAAWSGGWGALGSGTYAGYSSLGLNGWFKTADSGLTWVRMPGAGTGLPMGAQSVTPYFPPNYTLDRTVFLRWNGALYRSTDGGVTSTLVLSSGANDIAFVPGFRAASGTMFVATSSGLFKSVNGGLNFTALSSSAGSCTFLANDYTPVVEVSSAYAFDQAVFTINYNSSQSLCVSRDGGATWTARFDPGTIFNDFVLSPVYDDRAAAGTQQRMIFARGDTSIQVAPMRSTDGGLTFNPVAGIPAGLQYSIPFPSPALTLDTTVFMATAAGVYRSVDNGASYTRLGAGDQLRYRGSLSFYFSPGFDGRLTSNSSATLLADGAGIWRSTDGGRTFLPNGGEAFVSSSLNGIAVVPSTAAIPIVLAATGDEGVFRSDDGGISFANISPGLPAHANARAVHAPSAVPARPLAALAGAGASMWRYNNGTSTWLQGAAGDYRAFGEDGTYLYAMRRDGVSLRSTDGGATWGNQDTSKTDLVSVSSDASGGAPIVGNGDFELPYVAGGFVTRAAGQTFGGWTVESGTVDQIGSLWQAADGRQSVDMNGTGPGVIYRDLITTPGQQYLLRFSLAANPDAQPLCGGPIKQLQIHWNGGLLAQLSFDRRGHTFADMGWVTQQYTVSATAATTRLRFVSLDTSYCGNTLDAVSVTPLVPLAGPGGESPQMITSVTAPLWSVSAGQGPMFSYNNGTNWTAAPGSGDYMLPGGQSWSQVQALGLDSATGGRIVSAGTINSLWLTRDGGASWRRSDGTGSGLESTSKNVSAFVTAPTAFGTTDLLVGLTGSTTGGVYLSGDNGEHWTQINQGFDPNSLNITTLVKTSCSGCPVQYYTGTYGSGVYTRTIAVNNPPTITGWYFGLTSGTCGTATNCATAGAACGSEAGGQPFRLCGTGFQALATVEFDGVPASGCSYFNANTYICTGTPPHVPGPASVRLRNTDTRSGAMPVFYTYTAGTPRASNLRIAKSGSNASLSWSCATCSAGAPARIYRSQNGAFNLNVEDYSSATSPWLNSGALAAGSNPTYFWSVE